jgi:hypothetical protein
MRCRACNVILEDYEAVRKNTQGEYYDLCTICLSSGYAPYLEDDTNDFIVNISTDLLTLEEF